MSDDIIVRLLSIIIQANRIIISIQLIVGTFENLMNILIFTRRALRNNPCSLYFLASSIVVSLSDNVRNERLHTQDRELMKMLLIEVISSIICTVPFAIDTIFNAAVTNLTRSLSFMVVNTFADILAHVFIYFNPVVEFVFILPSLPKFREN
ncbi:unnamed protein product [Adineta steineri]|uniref:Uncharacterized protein n=1 Tax=Adineta steineri TaxID=433720 RepID=A0A820B4H8_9BILA|nr:unnamed protein product [Adineta steineri]CAF1497927.1 unnamed protein product [Adineta steineri]CAF4201592.1 unnamed protein product [Adineta steineri]